MTETPDPQHDSVEVDLKSSQSTIYCGQYTFHVDLRVAIEFVAQSRNSGGWGRLGPYLVHPGGTVVSPRLTTADGDVESRVVHIDGEAHDELRHAFVPLFGSYGD